MLHSRTTAASLQKIYEEGYLTCSTAVYYEGQGNEEEAMRCWKSAVEQIQRRHSDNVIPEYAAQSETEKALSDSLRELEYQAQERIDLLETLKLSRREENKISSTHKSGQPTDGMGYGRGSGTASSGGEGWIGDGTIPAITYGELSRPVPPLPPRPAPGRPLDSYGRTASYERLSTIKKSDSSSGSSGRGVDRSPTEAEAAEPPQTQSSTRNVLKKRTSRSPSHEKQDKPHTLRSTLRNTAPGESHHHSRSSRFSSKSRPSANKAATLAWSALGLAPRPESSRTSTIVESPQTRTHSSPSVLPPSSGKQREDSPTSSQTQLQWDSNSRRLVPQRSAPDPIPVAASRTSLETATAAAEVRNSGEYAPPHRPSTLSLNAAASALHRSLQSPPESNRTRRSSSRQRPPALSNASSTSIERVNSLTSLDASPAKQKLGVQPRIGTPTSAASLGRLEIKRSSYSSGSVNAFGTSVPERNTATASPTVGRRRARKERGNALASNEVSHLLADVQLEQPSSGEDSDKQEEDPRVEEEGPAVTWKKRKQYILKHLPSGVDEDAAKHILNEIVIQGDVVHWSDIAGLEPAKKALREVVVYPFLRPDLFMGLREPATGMLLFGPPGTGKTMLARAVATESKSTFFSISASSLTSKYLGESEKLVRALFGLAKTLAPSIIFVDEIDSILSQRSGSGEHEATRRIKTEFLIQWSDLQRAAAGRDDSNSSSNTRRTSYSPDRADSNASRVLVLAATNLPWAIDEAARRRFARRQYIPLPEAETRAVQLRTLLGQQKHSLTEDDIQRLVLLTDGFSGSDITALAKDAAMGPLRSLGEALLMTKMDEIRPMELADFVSSLTTIRPSVSKTGLKEYEDWAKEFGERGG